MIIFKNKKFYLIGLTVLVIVLVLLFAFFLRSRNGREILPATDPNIKLQIEEKYEAISQSRVTFFHTAPLACGLNIPENWEGSYRLEEKGSRAEFYYIASGGIKAPLFSIRYYPATQKTDDNEDVLLEKEAVKFTYSAAAAIDKTAINDIDFYEEMLAMSYKLARGIKCFTLSY